MRGIRSDRTNNVKLMPDVPKEIDDHLLAVGISEFFLSYRWKFVKNW